jgi:hypothetical protein
MGKSVFWVLAERWEFAFSFRTQNPEEPTVQGEKGLASAS